MNNKTTFSKLSAIVKSSPSARPTRTNPNPGAPSTMPSPQPGPLASNPAPQPLAPAPIPGGICDPFPAASVPNVDPRTNMIGAVPTRFGAVLQRLENACQHSIGPLLWSQEDFPRMKMFEKAPYDCSIDSIVRYWQEGEHRFIAADAASIGSGTAGDLSRTGVIGGGGTVTLTLGGLGTTQVAEFLAIAIRVALDQNVPPGAFRLTLKGTTGEPGSVAWNPQPYTFNAANNLTLFTHYILGWRIVGDQKYPASLRISPTSVLSAKFDGPVNAQVEIDPLVATHEDYRATLAELIARGTDQQA